MIDSNKLLDNLLKELKKELQMNFCGKNTEETGKEFTKLLSNPLHIEVVVAICHMSGIGISIALTRFLKNLDGVVND